jgi:surface polysaccharide O-acyltransferase-like enzyme
MSRRPEIELLRVAAMISVFAAHAAQPFNPWDIWHVQSPDRTKWLGELVLFLAPWVMPLFVLLAGASAWHSLSKRSAREYLNERVARLIVPLVAGILLLIPPQVYLDRRQHGLVNGSFLAFYPHFFNGLYPSGNFTLAHLWFLAVLALLALITLPFFQWLRRAPGRKTMAKLAALCGPQGAILLLVFPMIALRVALWMILPGSRPILIDWSNRTTLLAMFVYGYVLAGEPALMRAVDRQWKLMVGVAVAFSAAMFAWAWPGMFLERLPVPFSFSYTMLWSLYALGGLAWSLALLGAARAIPVGSRRWLDRASELLNPFYMLHQTVIVVLAFWLIGIGRGPIATYAMLFVTAFVATSVLCTLAKRWRVTRVVLGVRTVVPRDAKDDRHTAGVQINAILP